MSVLAGLAAAGAMTAVNNLMADSKATTAFKRQKDLMHLQSYYNNAANVNAPSQLVEGQRLAGLNPAMAESQSAPVASVSGGTAPQAENVEMSPSDVLAIAQTKNIEAQTEKTEAETEKIKGVDTKNVEADTALKAAQQLFAGANQKKVEAEATQIGNVNKVFQEENSAMGLFGQTTAQGWQKESWYSSLPKGARMVIDDIAKGDFDLTVGFANALDRMIQTDVDMNQAQKDKASFALTRSVIESQMKSPKVMEALVKTPRAQYGEILARATKLGVEANVLRFDLDWSKDRKDVWSRNDPDKLYADYQKDPTVENAAKWLVGSMRSTGVQVLSGTAPAAIHGSMMKKGLSDSKPTNTIQPNSKGEWNVKQFQDRYGTGEHFDMKKFEHDARAGKIPGVRYAPKHSPMPQSGDDGQGVQSMRKHK